MTDILTATEKIREYTAADADLVEYRAVDDTYRWIGEVEP